MVDLLCHTIGLVTGTSQKSPAPEISQAVIFEKSSLTWNNCKKLVG